MKGHEMWRETGKKIESLETERKKIDGLMDGVVKKKGGEMSR